jgi:ABC-type glycerol-3-phosphate transport system permease component
MTSETSNYSTVLKEAKIQYSLLAMIVTIKQVTLSIIVTIVAGFTLKHPDLTHLELFICNLLAMGGTMTVLSICVHGIQYFLSSMLLSVLLC